MNTILDERLALAEELTGEDDDGGGAVANLLFVILGWFGKEEEEGECVPGTLRGDMLEEEDEKKKKGIIRHMKMHEAFLSNLLDLKERFATETLVEACDGFLFSPSSFAPGTR